MTDRVIEKLIQSLSATSAQLAQVTSGPELERTLAHVDTLTARQEEFTRTSGITESIGRERQIEANLARRRPRLCGSA